MKKRTIVSLTLLFISIVLFVVLGGFLNNRKFFNDYIVNKETYDSLKGTLTKQEFGDINIKFDGYDLFYDCNDKRFYYSLIENRELSYNPQIEINKEYKIAIKDSKISDDVIKTNTSINFILYNNDYYEEYSLSCTTLPLMNIDYDGDEFVYDDQPMTMTLFDNRENAINRVTKSFGNVRLRGIFTAGLSKQGIRLSLLQDDWWTERKEDLLGLRKDDDWILYAGYNDVDKVRNVFCANLWNKTCAKNNTSDADTGTEYKYIELFINSKYYGLYALAYPIDAKQLNLKAGDALYQPYMSELENEITYANYDRVSENMRLKYGDNWNLLIDYYEKLFESYYNGDIGTIKEIIDIDNTVDFYLFNDIIQGDENALGSKIKNIKICIKNIGDKPRCIYVPWDFDMAFGNSVNYDSKNNTDNYCNNYDYDVIHTTNPVRLLAEIGDEEIDTKVSNRYKELREDKMSDKKIIDMIEEYETKIYDSGAYYRDMKRWPDGSYVDNEYNLDKFKEFVLNRMHYLDVYYGID